MTTAMTTAMNETDDRGEARTGTNSPWATALTAGRNRWLEPLALLVPGVAGIHLLAPRGGALIELALVALLVAAVAMWASSPRRGAGAKSARLQLVSREQLVQASEPVLRQAVADRRPLSVAVLELADLPELRRLFGRTLARKMLTRTAWKLRAVAGPKGLALRTSHTRFALVVPGVDAEAVLSSLRTVFGEACCIEDEGDVEEVVLLPQFHVATVDGDDVSIEPVYQGLCEKLVLRPRRSTQPRQEEEARDSLPALLTEPADDHDRAASTAYDPTLPLPLARQGTAS